MYEPLYFPFALTDEEILYLYKMPRRMSAYLSKVQADKNFLFETLLYIHDKNDAVIKAIRDAQAKVSDG